MLQFFFFTENFNRFNTPKWKAPNIRMKRLKQSLSQQQECNKTMKEWEQVMHLKTNYPVQGLDVEAVTEKLKRTVNIAQIIKEHEKRVNEFKLLGESRRRVVTNLANEMRLRLHFLGTPFDHFKVKKAWPEIRLLRDILLCCKKMLCVFIEEKLNLQYFSSPPERFAVVSIAETLLNELSYTAFQIHHRCEEMDMQNLCLLYRVCLYVLPKLKVIGQPTLTDETILRDFIEMQHR